MRAHDRHIIARRFWPAPVPAGTLLLPDLQPVEGAALTMSEAWDRYRAGLVEIATGRDTIDGHIVESLYAIPRKEPRKLARRVLGAGHVASPGPKRA